MLDSEEGVGKPFSAGKRALFPPGTHPFPLPLPPFTCSFPKSCLSLSFSTLFPGIMAGERA